MLLGKRLEKAAAAEELCLATGNRDVAAERHQAELLNIVNDIRVLLARIDGDIPLIQLAITASGESLSTSLPATISPSRLLQASMFLTLGDTQFESSLRKATQIGPSFTLSLYMIFVGHSPDTAKRVNSLSDGGQHKSNSENEKKKSIWQEVVHKVRVRLCRTSPGWEFDQEVGYLPRVPSMTGSEKSPNSNTGVVPFSGMDGYSYHLEIIEDLDDGRVHEEEEQPERLCMHGDIRRAGIRESIPIHQIAKIFYTDTGRILNIGGTNPFENNAVLLLKRDFHATVPTSTMDHMTPGQGADDGGIGPGQSGHPDLEGSSPSTDQDDIDRQLMGEAGCFPAAVEAATTGKQGGWRLPRHLDPEWLALEVFGEDDDVGSDKDDEDEDSDVGFDVLEQLQHLSVSESEPEKAEDEYKKGQTDLSKAKAQNDYRVDEPPREELPASRPLLGTVASSLSLLEMLIRLTSLQEFQQASHLSIPDHILTFFLEESSTTGLCGEEQWKAKKEAKQRMGFDPYVDTPM